MQRSWLLDGDAAPVGLPPGACDDLRTAALAHEPRGRVERYEGSDGHVYLIEYLKDRFVAHFFAGGTCVAGQLPSELPLDMSKDQTARTVAIQAIEEKISAARATTRKT